MVDFTVEKCKTKATYSAKLKKQQQLSLDTIKKKVKIVLETPILLVIEEEGVQLVVHKYGELLFQNCQDVPLMERIAEKIFQLGLKQKSEAN